MFERLTQKKEQTPDKEVPHFEELTSLGINWDAELTKYGYKYTFRGATKLGDKYYSLDSNKDKVLFSTLHYNEDNERGFLHPDSHKKTDFNTVISHIRENFPDIDHLILSTCYPVYAKKFAEDNNSFPMENVILLGNNDREYSVVFYPKKGIIEVIPTKTSIEDPHKK